LKNKRKVLIIVGPTASAKSQVALSVARMNNLEIVSADSRQIYKYMDIGTAKPSKAELSEIKHHFIDELSPDTNYNAGNYGKDARDRIGKTFFNNKYPLVVGGSGLYIQALIDGIFNGPMADQDIRHELNRRLETEGVEDLLKELWKVDQKSAEKMIPGNTRRIIRALEVYLITGCPISELQKENVLPSFDPVLVALSWDRRLLYNRINTRVNWMFENGLLAEVDQLRQRGYSLELNALQTVGYKEAFKYLNGEYKYDEMVDLIKRNSRRYAKRQLTWFRRDQRIKWLDIQNEKDLDAVPKKIMQYFDINSVYN
jgi:tRNA dimethylallyltransferase